MSYNNGIITVPVGASDPYYVLGIGAYNGTWDVKFPTQLDKINKWAIHKPVANLGPVSEDTYIHDEINGISYMNGLRIPLYNFQIYGSSSDNLKNTGLYFQYLRVRDDDWGNLAHWAGYNHNATSPVESYNIPDKVIYQRPENFFAFRAKVSDSYSFRLHDLYLYYNLNKDLGKSYVSGWYYVFIVDTGERNVSQNHPGLMIWHTGVKLSNQGVAATASLGGSDFSFSDIPIGNNVKCYIALVGSNMDNWNEGQGQNVTAFAGKMNLNYLILNMTDAHECETLCQIASVEQKWWESPNVRAEMKYGPWNDNLYYGVGNVFFSAVAFNRYDYQETIPRLEFRVDISVYRPSTTSASDFELFTKSSSMVYTNVYNSQPIGFNLTSDDVGGIIWMNGPYTTKSGDYFTISVMEANNGMIIDTIISNKKFYTIP